MDSDVIIVGAGVAGLMAARELKRAGLSFLILEAEPHIGGRAATVQGPEGVPIDTGAHWLHGAQNPLKELLDQYKIPYVTDTAEHTLVFHQGKVLPISSEKWLENAIDKKKAAAVKSGKATDCPLPELASDDEGRASLAAFSRMWDGAEPPLMPSAREFLTDQNVPGGLQVKGGIATLVNRLAEEIGTEFIRTGIAVTHIAQDTESVTVATQNGETLRCRKLLFTGSLGVLAGNHVLFTPTLGVEFQKAIAQIAMGRITKIIVVLDSEFFAARKIPCDLGMELLDSEPPQFCHVQSAGKPTLMLYIPGNKAQEAESFTAAEAIAHLKEVLAPVDFLQGFEQHLKGEPVISRWNASPTTLGAYSFCLPGGKRTGPLWEGNICFCGDTFDETFPASMAGAARSGQEAGKQVAAKIKT